MEIIALSILGMDRVEPYKNKMEARSIETQSDDQATHPESRSPPMTSEETKAAPQPELATTLSRPQPQFRSTLIYALRGQQTTLHWTDLLTGEEFSQQIHGFEFHYGCRWNELPGGSLLITGGQNPSAVGEVVMIDTQKEFLVSSQPPMFTPRFCHAALHHSQYVYVLGGEADRCLNECERFVCLERQWEVLPALPVACTNLSAVELDNSLYALGGFSDDDLDIVQRLSLDSLTWELMQLKLPQECSFFPCFKTDTQAYLVIENTLYSFTPLQITPIKTLSQSAPDCYSCNYARDTLYITWYEEFSTLVLGELA
jgi:hypothetical protein